jgi:Fur family ferric uptake transcriptional regulator
MGQSRNYNTRQREAILNCVAALNCVHVTAPQIIERFKKENIPMGRATIFRHLDKLAAEGLIRRYTVDGISGACYQYIDNRDDCRAHLHLKCKICGVLQHLECETLDEIQRNVFDRRMFEVDALKTVLYGTCIDCLNKV